MRRIVIFISFFTVLAAALLASCGSGGGNQVPADGSDTTGDSWEDAVVECVDRDGDGYGHGCDRGGDCDDFDPDHWSDCDDCGIDHDEGCACEPGESYFCYDGPAATMDVGQCQRGLRSCVDGTLGRCEGQVLPSAMEDCEDGIDNNCNGETDEARFCDDCIPPCYTEGIVEPTAMDPGSTGLVPNPDGPGVVLGSSEEEGGFAWIANSSEGTVSKLDVQTGAEVGRYRVGLWGSGNDSPSRTAVDDYQNAYVANRAFDRQGSVTKIAGFERYCVDRNGNGIIDTSHGSSAMGLDEDECVLWTAEVGGDNGIPRSLVIDFGTIETRGGYPWVGLYNEKRFYKLDPNDGGTLETVDVDVHTYGAAIDSGGWIWVSGRGSEAIQRFHYSTLSVEGAIFLPSSTCRGAEPYGIAVDLSDRVWVGAWDEGGACRYDPAGGSWFFVDTGGRARGVAVDKDNVIWASNDDNRKLYRFNADDGTDLASYDVGASTPIGVGADRLGKIWTINHGSDNAARFDPSTATFDRFPVGSDPYTYSDFLGLQRWLMMPIGIWIRTFERCDEKEEDGWREITWDTETPSDSHITIVARSANEMSGILTAPEVTIADIGPDDDTGAKSLEDVYSDAGAALGKYIEITVIMEPGVIDVVSPVFKSLQLFYFCSDLG